MNTYRILHGDALTMLRTLPDNSVHCVVTSPPYWGLRDYGHDEQIGLEETPDAYVARLVDVFREVRRVLRDDGTCWLNLGDSYNGSGGAGGDYYAGGLKEGQPRYPGRNVGALKPKDLVGIPWRVAFALQADGWWLRQDIIWHKTAPMPESVTDRCTKAHEYVFLLTKSARYYYDAQAIAEPAQVGFNGSSFTSDYDQQTKPGLGMKERTEAATRNKRSVWTLGPEPYSEAHFATMPPTLAELCIRAGSSAHGCCSYCGAPWERVVEREQKPQGRSTGNVYTATAYGNPQSATWGKRKKLGGDPRETETIGWQPTCTHEAERIPCTVLDPFAGSGTTLAVSLANGRNSIGVELNAEYIRLAEKRITGTQPALLGV